MVKRELSNNLRNMKFMQRALSGDEKSKKEEEDAKPDEKFFNSTAATRKCVVIVEGDPHPAAAGGRMSFQNFNPLIEKINEAQTIGEAPTISPNSQGACVRENVSSSGRAECMDMDEETHKANGNLKRKHDEVVECAHNPTEAPRNGQSIQNPPHSKTRRSRKKSKHEKVDWSVLRPPKYQQMKG
ncbi:hypothetical protein SAY87_013216 [Trapa incisa]|uniref:M-phase phosphoprotein 6 n=1 Tax=Trapa incisa TaxID=236973 RepID=A0AAN7KFZ5_9MYRT|nr:hypothetical protein SAY87_013216 [Trapa incisa]